MHMNMQDQNASAQPALTAPAQGQSGVSRREMLVGTGAVLSGLWLAGCGGNKSQAMAGADGAAEPIAAAPAQTDWNSIYNHYAPQTGYVPPREPTVSIQPPRAVVQQGVPVLPRSSWTRAGVARPREIYAMGGVSRITVHHDGMPPTSLRSMGDVAARIEQIRLAHIGRGREWADIGYHYIIDPQGRVWEGRNIGYQGAHVKDQNEHNLGVLVLGNFELQRPTAAALASLDRFVYSQMTRYNVTLGRLRTHREIAQTECPGANLQAYMLRTRAGGGMLASLASQSGLARG